MQTTRRNFFKTAVGASALSLLPARALARDTKPSDDALERAAARPVLDVKGFKEPIVIESIQLLKTG